MHRRSFLTGLAASIVAAPAIVRAASLMPVRAIVPVYGVSPIAHIVAQMRQLEAYRMDMLLDWDACARYVIGDVMRCELIAAPHSVTNIP